MSLVSVSDSSIIDHTLHPNSHPSSICVLSSHLLKARKIGQAACRNVSHVSVGHADCSDRPLYELLSTAPMPRIQSRWPFLQMTSCECGGTELQAVRCHALPSVRRRLAYRMNMFSVAELETLVEGEDDW